MALRHFVSVVSSGAPRLAPLSTAPATREQRAAGPATVLRRGAAEPARPQFPAVDFGNAQEAYRSRRSWELVRSLLVLRLCASPALLARHEQLLHLSRRFLGQKLFDKLMKMTFYGHFVAGEDQESIRPLIQHNRTFGVGSILDYGVEEDLSTEEAERQEMESCTSEAERKGSGTSKREKQYQAHRAFGDRRDGVISARTYFYANEAKCDSHMETFLRCIEASGTASDDGFSAIKLTALGRPQFLESVAKMGIASRKEIENWFTAETLGVSGTLDLLDWSSLINSRTELSKHLVVPNMQTGQLEPLLLGFTEEEEQQMTRMLQRMDVLAKKATEVGVRLMVDAEQTYFQPAISRLTLEMQRKFNVEKPLIFNTYQCYLRDAYDNVTVDVELARREGWCFGAKLVRGAYMAQERARAEEIGYEDPINPTYEATNVMYHRCLNYVLEELKHNAKAQVMVASHNEDTVQFTLRRMEELGLHPADCQVYFGQLLGMCDQISFPLGQAGFPVYKYVPFGPVMEVLPYLSRRALENSSVMKGAQRERQLLWQELRRRLRTGSLFYRPA
ncbi:Proline dehydrogenase, mitochondrial [Pteropus alecto]|uniref:Proline dehydrogenase n=1 Tax=Pteropus alecto TaxID=9402 RepID=L5KEP7_PTEAL|nr:Proline dehydrogenase, mitochondrial [Pteropus alecto]